jgi:hypothetical protein
MKDHTQQFHEDDGATTEESDESKSKISELCFQCI